MDYPPPPPPPPPAPPSTADHHQPHHPHPPPPPNPYHHPSQFQYQYHSPLPPPPPPPPPQQQQWVPPPYPPPQHHHHYPPQYPPPRPPPPYHQLNQGYNNANWGPQQTWDFQAHTNEEDWAAKARAWAASKATIDQQQLDPQSTPVGRPVEPTPYHDPHALPIESQFLDMQQPSHTAPNYLQHPAPVTPQHRPPISHPQEFASLNSGQSPYRNLSGEAAGAFHQPQQSSMSHQQEVPSSYSSIAGNGDAGLSGTHYMSSSFLPASAPQHHLQPPLPASGISMPMEEQQYIFRGQSTDPATSLSDQPLDFAPRYNHDYERHAQATYSDSGVPVKGFDNVSPVPSNYSWGPHGSGVIYPSVPPMIPSASQVDPSMAIPSPVLGHNSTTFGVLPISNFQSSGPPVGPPYTVGVGPALHSPAAFSGDGFGVSDFSERPKKPSVPNWLREEIIKKKAVMTSSTMEYPGSDNQLMEDDSMDRTYGNSEPADSKSIDSSKSTEEEDEDEDDVEAARTAAINQEIKRVLTEVLLKVTDELFDEIATKVLNEDDIIDEHQNVAVINKDAPIPSRTAPINIVEPKVLIPVKVKEAESDDANEKSTSTLPGDILGLASYASDDEDDDKEIQSSEKPSSKGSKNNMDTDSYRTISGKNLVENGLLLEGNEKPNDKLAGTKIDAGIKKQVITTGEGNPAVESKQEGDSVVEEEEMLMGIVSHVPKETVVQAERPGNSKTSSIELFDGRIRSESDKSERHEMRRNSSDKDYVKDENIHKGKVNEKGFETRGRYDEKNFDREKNGDQSARIDKAKEKGAKTGDKGKDSDSRIRSSPDVKETKRDRDKERKSSFKEENGGKKERTKDGKGEKIRPKSSKDSGRHKRHHSPTESRGKDSKDSSGFSETGDSDDESAIASRRKRRARRNESPSPVRSKRRYMLLVFVLLYFFPIHTIPVYKTNLKVSTFSFSLEEVALISNNRCFFFLQLTITLTLTCPSAFQEAPA
ncbi:hypothetical protein LIER_02050 [Lithospermum erythrorhizon]|uniref:Uncharacterized protein n=1 Tax=Lithospermum erythrorhizon TaxID=34254 RepID=A0AAV3NSS4_LITER